MFSISDGLKLPHIIAFAEQADELLFDADIAPLTSAQAKTLSDLVNDTLPLGLAAKKAIETERQTPSSSLKGFVKSAAKVFTSRQYTYDTVFRDHLFAFDMVRLVAKEAFENRLKYVDGAEFTSEEIAVMRDIERAFIYMNVPDDSAAHDNQLQSLYGATTEGRVTSTAFLMDLHNRGVETYRYGGGVYVERTPLQPDQKSIPER